MSELQSTLDVLRNEVPHAFVYVTPQVGDPYAQITSAYESPGERET